MEELVRQYEAEDWNILQHYVEAARNGSRGAWEYLKKRYTRVVMKRAREYFFPGSEKADVESTAWFGFCQAIMIYKHKVGRKLSVFISFHVRDILLMELRKSQRHKQQVLTNAKRLDDFDNVEDEFSEHEIVTAITRSEILERLFVTLSDFEYSALMLFIEGDTYEEIMQDLGCNYKAVDNGLIRARRKIKEINNM